MPHVYEPTSAKICSGQIGNRKKVTTSTKDWVNASYAHICKYDEERPRPKRGREKKYCLPVCFGPCGYEESSSVREMAGKITIYHFSTNALLRSHPGRAAQSGRIGRGDCFWLWIICWERGSGERKHGKGCNFPLSRFASALPRTARLPINATVRHEWKSHNTRG